MYYRHTNTHKRNHISYVELFIEIRVAVVLSVLYGVVNMYAIKMYTYPPTLHGFYVVASLSLLVAVFVLRGSLKSLETN